MSASQAFTDRRVVIVSPVHNRREITLQCLRSLERADTRGLWVHKIIVDDGSTDGTSDAIKEAFPSVEVLHGNGDLWCFGAANLGIARALELDPDYVLLINDDAVFDSKFLVNMVKTAEFHKRSVVGGLLLLWDQPHRVFQVAPRWDTWYGGWRHYQAQTVWTVPREPFDVDLIVGNCMLVPVNAFREEGLFDERIPHFADSEFTPRLKRRGWKLLIEPTARVFNKPNDFPPKLSEMSFAQLYNALWQKYHGAHNLRNRFMCNWLGAPSRLQGAIGFAVYVMRLCLQGAGLGPRWMKADKEKPMVEEYPSP